jgi:hypothetical protein
MFTLATLAAIANTMRNLSWHRNAAIRPKAQRQTKPLSSASALFRANLPFRGDLARATIITGSACPTLLLLLAQG